MILFPDTSPTQAQLAQTLAAQQQQQSGASQVHCNTPTARTPTMSFANWSAMAGATAEPRRSRSSSLSMAARRAAYPTHDSDTIIEESMDEDDEFAVEQLVGEPGLSGPSSLRYRERAESLLVFDQQQHWSSIGAQNHELRAHFSGPGVDLAEHATSSYAASDPFYAAVEASSQQAHQYQPRQGTFFGQLGHPAQQSPFYAAQSLATTSGGFDTFTHSMDQRARFVTTGTVDA